MFSVLEFVVEVRNARLRIEHHIFQHRAEPVGGGIDLGLRFLRELDAFGVAAALEIEHPVGSPPVLVVADQDAVGIGRQRRLAGAGEPEEQRNVAVPADIGRAMHGHDALRRQIEIERGEDRLLDLAGIGGVSDQNDLPAEIDGDHGLAAHPVALGVGLERGHVDNGEIGNEVGELGTLGTDQQLADEEGMPGELGENAGLDPVGGIGAAIEVLREQLAAARMRDQIVVEALEIGLRDLAVAFPPDRAFGQVVDHRVLVLGRAAGMDPGLRAERAAFHQRSLLRRNGMLVKRRGGQIPMDGAEVLESEFVGAVALVPQTGFLHGCSLHDGPAEAGRSPIKHDAG